MPKQIRCSYNDKTSEVTVTNQKADLLQGTLDMLILKALSLGPLHGYGVIQRIRQMSGRDAHGRTGRPLPGALPHRAKRLGQLKVGRERDRPQGEVLHADESGPKAARRRGTSWDLLALPSAKVRQAT